VLRPGGTFLLGMPAVNLMMEAGFALIGFRGINHHHVTTPQRAAARFAAHGFVVKDHARLKLPLPSSPELPVQLPAATPGLSVYYVWRLERT
jgi:hypothetical protein